MKRDLQVGDQASASRVFTEADVARFAELTGDRNPIHLDAEYAAASVFGERIVHGMLAAGLFSALIGTEMPGIGTLYLGQTLAFKAPIRIGERATATVEITHIREDKPIVTLRTLCHGEDGQLAIEGEAVVKTG